MVTPTDLVTNCHFVRQATRIEVRQGEATQDAKVRYRDLDRNLCQLSMTLPLPGATTVVAFGACALKVRAAQHGHSTEAQIRVILEGAVRPSDRPKIGSILAAFGKQHGGHDLKIVRDKAPGEPAQFE